MPPELVVASFNVHWGRGPRPRFEPFDVTAACASLHADVLVLQESWDPDDGKADHDAVAAELGYEVVEVAPMARVEMEPRPRIVSRGGDPEPGGNGSWNLVLLSRRPVHRSSITRLPQLMLDPVARAIVRADVEVDGRAVTVCGAHMPHLQFGSPLVAPALRAALPTGEDPAVFAGDMNMWGWTIDRFTTRHWQRVVSGKTFPAHRPHSQIDHILVAGGVSAVTSDVVPVPGSDHLPVRAVLRLPG